MHQNSADGPTGELTVPPDTVGLRKRDKRGQQGVKVSKFIISIAAIAPLDYTI